MEAAGEDVLKYGSLPTIMLLISQYERVETLTVLVSGWFDGPVWVAVERPGLGLQTISIPRHRDWESGLSVVPRNTTRANSLNYQRVSVNTQKDSHVETILEQAGISSDHP